MSSKLPPPAVLLIGCLAVLVSYCQGLSGGFWLDDYSTLPGLAQWGDLNSVDKFWQFVSRGFAGPTGRPVALITFALQSGAWPNDAESFLIVNIAIHMMNGLLLYVFLRLLCETLSLEAGWQRWLPVVVSLVWLAHPLNVSAVLYVVQRMVLLSAFFNFLALACYLVGRRQFLSGGISRSVAWLLLGCLAALCALCSKENAILIPLQLWLIEALLIWSGKGNSNKWWLGVQFVGVILPSLVVLFYLWNQFDQHLFHYLSTGQELATRRSFTMFERLATQMHIVGDYLKSIVIPRGQGAGVFYDGYPLAHGLLSPISTLWWFVLHLTGIVLAFIYRRRLPLIAFGVLWFYVNHLVESSVILLELKFEHRNYIPEIGILLVVVVVCGKYLSTTKLKTVVTIVGLCTLVTFLTLRSNLWGQPEKAVLVWIKENPASIRALESAALIYDKRSGGGGLAQDFLEQAMELSDEQAASAVKYLSSRCGDGTDLDLLELQISQQLSDAQLEWYITGPLGDLLSKMISGHCPNVTEDGYQEILSAIVQNPKYKSTQIPLKIQDLSAKAELILGDRNNGIAQFLSINYSKAPLGHIMTQAYWLAVHDELPVAVELLENGIKYQVEADDFLLTQSQDMLSKMKSDLGVSK